MGSSNLFVQILNGFPLDVILCNSLLPTSIGFVITTIYRYIVKELDWRNWKLKKTIVFLFGSTIILASTFMLTIYLIISVFFGSEELTIAAFFSNMFIFTLIILTWNLIYFTIHYFNNWTQAEVEKWKLAAEIKDAQLGSLKSQIKPHFVFNTINNIRSLILEDKEKAREMLLNFSDLFRYALKNSDQSKAKLEDEIEIVKQYLELVSIQYEDKLQYSISVDEGMEAVLMPPMMLQLLVENAVKHGISQFKEGGSIIVDVKQLDEEINIRVKNTGNFNTTSSLGDQLGVGLKNIRKRLELIYNGEASIAMDEVGDKVVASIKIPIS